MFYGSIWLPQERARLDRIVLCPARVSIACAKYFRKGCRRTTGSPLFVVRMSMISPKEQRTLLTREDTASNLIVHPKNIAR